MITDRLVWCDIETTGLDPETDLVLEMGFVITDLNLNVIDDYSTTVWDTPTYDQKWAAMKESGKDQFVVEMHEKSGLISQATMLGATPVCAAQEVGDWLSGHGVRGAEEPLCGSSVHFDRTFLVREPYAVQINTRFTYRNVDVSSIKELCAAYAPDVTESLPPARKLHRVLSDLEDTINEFRHYMTHFVGIDPKAFVR